MQETTVDRATRAALAELHRQGLKSGCFTEDNGRLAQVDGSFDVRRLVEAVLKVASEDRGPLT
jgi:hypothetical protein